MCNIYFNGRWKEQSVALATPTGFDYGWLIGTRYDFGSPIQGSVVYFAMYPMVLTPTQIADAHAHALADASKV